MYKWLDDDDDDDWSERCPNDLYDSLPQLSPAVCERGNHWMMVIDR